MRSAAARATVVLPAPAGAISTAPPWSAPAASTCSIAGSSGAVFQSTGTRRSLGRGGGGRAALVYVGGVSSDCAPAREERRQLREWAVCVYCASGPRHPELLDLA